MSFVPADITGVTKQTLGLLNASSAYAAVTDDDKFTDGLIAECVFQGDERTYTAIAETKGHWARPDIMDWSSDITTYLAEAPAKIGEFGDVRIKYVSTDTAYQLAKKLGRQEIEVFRRNTSSRFSAAHNASGTITAGYYDPDALSDGVCAFSGYAMQIRIATYTRTSALQSPQNYSSLIVAHVLSLLFTVDGLDPQLAGYYSREADKREGMVRANMRTMMELKNES